MEAGKVVGEDGEQDASAGKRRAWPKWLRLTLVLSINLLLVALVIGLWARGPTSMQPPLPRAIINYPQPGISGHNLVLVPPSLSCTGATNTLTPIVAENACAGTETWRQTLPLGPTNAISAYPVPASVNIGQDIQFFVTTTARAYTFSVFRVGWYHGHGARLLYTSPNIRGVNQPPPTYDPVTNAASDANWHDPVSLQIPDSWVSGVYIVKFVTSDGNMRYTLFVVRNDASHAPVLFQLALATYQAYNEYGGRSLYGEEGVAHTPDKRAYAVSFDRPYAEEAGLADLPLFEGPYIRFLEHAGYDMSYMSDIDLVLHPQPLTQHKLLIIGGHDEYWDDGMRQAATQALSQGVSLAFFFANSVYWHTRMSASPLGPDRIITCYRYADLDPLSVSNPSAATVQWANPPVNNPESSLIGEDYLGIPAHPAPLVLSSGAQPYFTGTHLQAGISVPGLVSGEVDTYVQNSAEPQNVTILAKSPVMCREYPTIQTDYTTIYTAPSGAMVFDSGAFGWYLGLNASWFGPGGKPAYSAYFHDMERFTANILNAMIEAPRHAHDQRNS